MQSPLAIITLVALLSSSQQALADTFSGRVVDRHGVGIAGIDIDAVDDKGDPVTLSNDTTNVNGNFNVTVDPGLYWITFNAPLPPAPRYVPLTVDNVLVIGAIDLGTLTMADGAVISGLVFTSTGLPVEAVDLDVLDANGDQVVVSGDRTGPSGEFAITVPTGKFELRFDPKNAAIQVLAPTRLNKYAGQDKDLGTIILQPGLEITAAIRDSGFDGVEAADVDTVDTVTGEKLYTPSDNTDNNGFVDFIVPAGVYDFEICPQFDDELVTKLLPAIPVTADTSLGIVVLDDGVVLSGVVRSLAGTPLHGVDLDLRDSFTLTSVAICDDNTNGSGFYAVIVPNGTFDLIFRPNYSLPYGMKRIFSVTITSDTTVNTVLSDCDCLVAQGSGVTGTGGLLPKLVSKGGCLRVGNPHLRLKVRNARGGAMALITAGVSQGSGAGAFGGGTQPFGSLDHIFTPITPIVLTGIPGTAGTGSGSISAPLPGDPTIAGLSIVAHAVIRDPQAKGGLARTRQLVGTACE